MRSECMSEHGRHPTMINRETAAPRCECREKGAPDEGEERTGDWNEHCGPSTLFNSTMGAGPTRPGGRSPSWSVSPRQNIVIIARFIYSQRKLFDSINDPVKIS